MKFSNDAKGREKEIISLFGVTFADSEGADEGALIGKLVAPSEGYCVGLL